MTITALKINESTIWTQEILPNVYNYSLHSVVYTPSCVLYLSVLKSFTFSAGFYTA